jgi:hypothetical protein
VWKARKEEYVDGSGRIVGMVVKRKKEWAN